MSVMTVRAAFQGNFGPLYTGSSCRLLRFMPAVLPSAAPQGTCSRRIFKCRLPRLGFCKKRGVTCRMNDKEEPATSDDKEEVHEDGEARHSKDSPVQNSLQTGDQEMDIDQDNDKFSGPVNPNSEKAVDNSNTENNDQESIQLVSDSEVTSGSPLPGLKSQQFNDSMRIPKESIELLRNQVFGFDTFFVTSQEPYEGGVLFKGNLRGKAAESHEKIRRRMVEKFGNQYLLFLLINPEDDKPVAVVVPRKTLQFETTAVPEWFAAGAFGLVTISTLLLRNVPALQSNILSTFDNLNLLKDGLPGAAVTALTLGVHELGQIAVANSVGITLGVPYFVPSWQIGSFGAITRITNIVSKREDLLKVAAAGPLAGFATGLLLLLLGFILPPSNGFGVIVDASVFHGSFLAGGIAKLLLGDALKEGTPVSVNPLVLWAWAGLLINAINSIPAGELDGGRISFALWGRKASTRLTAASIALLGLSSLFSDVAFYWAALIFFLQRSPIAPLSEEISDPDDRYVGLGILVLLLGLLICLPYPFPFTNTSIADL